MRRKFKPRGYCWPASRLYVCRLLFFVVLFSVANHAHAQESMIDTTLVEIDSTYMDEPDETGDDENGIYFTPKTLQNPSLDSVAARNVPETTIQAYRQMDEFWYANIGVKKEEKEKVKRSLFDQPWFDSLMLFVIIGGFALVLIMYLSSSNAGLFRRRNKAINEDEHSLETEDIFQINYQREIDRAAGAGNYRLAIRLMFLRLLKNLSQKNIIQYGHDRT